MEPQVTVDEFMVKLGGRSEYKKLIRRLTKEQELLRIQIESLVADAIADQKEFINSHERAIWSTLRRFPGQHIILFDTDCEKSPYGMHGRSDVHICTKCVWCSIEVAEI